MILTTLTGGQHPEGPPGGRTRPAAHFYLTTEPLTPNPKN